MPVWILIVNFILIPFVCALCFWLGAHSNYKIFMSDPKFDEYVSYHRAFAKMFGAKKPIEFDAIELDDNEDNSKAVKQTEEGKSNGGY